VDRYLPTLALVALLAAQARAETIVLEPPAGCTSSEELESVANSLQPGDELILSGGTYCQTSTRYLDVRGTAQAPIVIRAADGEIPILTRLDDPTQPQTQNGTDVYGEYLVLRGLHFERGDTGLRFLGGHHVTIEDCEISNTSNNALTLNTGSTDSFIIRRNHIHDTGLLDLAYGGTEGEGMYIGTPGVVASNHLIENNYIHHLRSTSPGGNDGIEIKYGSYGNVVRHNVIHDTTIGTAYPCIFVYGVLPGDEDAPNIVEGNAMWNCGEAIQVASDAIVRNNLILNSLTGITATIHAQVPVLQNTVIVNNTIYGHQSEGLYIRWSGAPGMVLANNAIYNPGGVAIDEQGLFDPGVVTGTNYVEGSGVPIDGVSFVAGGAASLAFADPAQLDFWPQPGSPLAGSADPAFAPADDFNGTLRTSPSDVGAYQSRGLALNPGWPLAGELKALDGTTPPALWFESDRVTLSWSAVGVADEYDVYRGELADLDLDHGVCVSAADPDLADTAFVDPDPLPAAGNGYFYLIEFRQGLDRSGLGWDGSGNLRNPATLCP